MYILTAKRKRRSRPILHSPGKSYTVKTEPRIKMSIFYLSAPPDSVRPFPRVSAMEVPGSEGPHTTGFAKAPRHLTAGKEVS